MIITRIKGESYKEDVIFSINYKDLYDEISEQKCVIDMLSLVTGDKKLFSRFLERDKHLDPDKKEMCNDFLMGYHKGYQYDPDGYFEKEIKNILFKYNKINGESNKNIDDVKDLIFKKFKNT